MEWIPHIIYGVVWANVFWLVIGWLFGKEESWNSKENLIVYLITGIIFSFLLFLDYL